MKPQGPLILVAEDDADDYVLLQEAQQEMGLPCRLKRAVDGQDVLDYLLRQGAHAPPVRAPRPNLVLLELNMPRKRGIDTILEIKNNSKLISIPLLVFTGSGDQEDVNQAYYAGASGFIRRPVRFKELVQVFEGLYTYWFKWMQLPESIS